MFISAQSSAVVHGPAPFTPQQAGNQTRQRARHPLLPPLCGNLALHRWPWPLSRKAPPAPTRSVPGLLQQLPPDLALHPDLTLALHSEGLVQLVVVSAHRVHLGPPSLHVVLLTVPGLGPRPPHGGERAELAHGAVEAHELLAVKDASHDVALRPVLRVALVQCAQQVVLCGHQKPSPGALGPRPFPSLRLLSLPLSPFSLLSPTFSPPVSVSLSPSLVSDAHVCTAVGPSTGAWDTTNDTHSKRNDSGAWTEPGWL